MTDPERPLTESGMRRQLTALEKQVARYSIQRGGTSRLIEDAGFVVGLGLLGLRGVAEILPEMLGPFMALRPHEHQFPTALILSSVLLVAPKWLGKASAGRVWEALGAGGAKLIGRGRPAGPGEPEP
jgi:hypothetical protein